MSHASGYGRGNSSGSGKRPHLPDSNPGSRAGSYSESSKNVREHSRSRDATPKPELAKAGSSSQNKPRMSADVAYEIFDRLQGKDIRKAIQSNADWYRFFDDHKMKILRIRLEKKYKEFKTYLDGFNYKGMPLLDALSHWTQHKGLWLGDANKDNANNFALWFARCQGHDENNTAAEAIPNLGIYVRSLYKVHARCFVEKQMHCENWWPMDWGLSRSTIDFTGLDEFSATRLPLWVDHLIQNGRGVLKGTTDWERVQENANILGCGTMYGEDSYMVLESKDDVGLERIFGNSPREVIHHNITPLRTVVPNLCFRPEGITDWQKLESALGMTDDGRKQRMYTWPCARPHL